MPHNPLPSTFFSTPAKTDKPVTCPAPVQPTFEGTQNFFKGADPTVPPAFVPPLLFSQPLNIMSTGGKIALMATSTTIGAIKAGVEAYKRNYPCKNPQQYPAVVKLIDTLLGSTDGFALAVVPFLFAGLHEVVRPDIQAHKLAIVLASTIYAAGTGAMVAYDLFVRNPDDLEAGQPLLNHDEVDPEKNICISNIKIRFEDVKNLKQYLDTFLSGIFELAPFAFTVHDFYAAFNPAAAGTIAGLMVILGVAKVASLHYKNNHPDVRPENYPGWVKLIDLVSATALGFSLAVVPALYTNAVFGLNQTIKNIWTSGACIYSAMTAINEADKLDVLPRYNPSAPRATF